MAPASIPRETIRGLEETEFGADLTVRVSSREVERTDVRGSGWEPYPWGTWGFHPRWGYYRRPWGYWGRYGYGGDVWTRRYIEGSVLIDVIDRDAGQLVYRVEVSDETGSNLDKFVTRTVDKAFKKFPVKETSD